MGASKIIVLEKVDSTNNYAMALIQKGGIRSGTGIFAVEQTSGRGRRGKTWNARPGKNITLSVVVEMKWQPVSAQFPLSVAVALGCRDFISSLVKKDVFIKWPNDIFVNDSKAAGVLIENVLKGTLWQWSIIGIGLNVNQDIFEEIDANVTSLKIETGKSFDVLRLAEDLQHMVLKRIEELKIGKFPVMLAEYNEHLYARAQLVRLKKNSMVFETTIQSVSASGQLITKDSMERHFNFDEVTFRGIV